MTSIVGEDSIAIAHTALERFQVVVYLDSLDLRAGEARMIEHALVLTAGNRTKAAQLLGINLRTLRRKLNGPKTKSQKCDPAQLSIEDYEKSA